MPQQVFEGMSSRKRRPNWTDQECLVLAKLMQEKKDIIRGKSTSGVSVQDKRQAWEEITHAINAAFPQTHRTVIDCNKKWENLLAKAREEIKRLRRQVGTDDGLSLEQFSTVTQIVISVMNLSGMLVQDTNGSSALQMGIQQNSCDRDENHHTLHETPLSEDDFSSYVPCNIPTKEEPTIVNIPKLLSVRVGSPHPVVAFSSGEPLSTPCSTSSSLVNGTTLQERMDLEISVLRRQEAVLKLQEEYYTLKIKMMKKQMEGSPLTQ